MPDVTLTPDELHTIRGIAARAGRQRRALNRAHQASQAAPPGDFQELVAGDLVQLRPSADAAFGGMLAVITRAEPYELSGYLLRPHRGACREAWLRLKHCDVERVGHAIWPAATSTFAGRCDTRGPACRYAP